MRWRVLAEGGTRSPLRRIGCKAAGPAAAGSLALGAGSTAAGGRQLPPGVAVSVMWVRP